MGMGLRSLSLAACAVLAASLVAAPASQAAVPPSPWLQSGSNAAGSHANLTESLLSPANVAMLHRQRNIAGASDYSGCGRGATATAISEGRVYTIVDDHVTAYNLDSGAVIWRATNPATTDFDALDSTIAVSHGQVVISGNECGTNDPFAFVQTFDSATGTPGWDHTYGDGISGVEVSGSYVVAHVYNGIETVPSTSVYRIGNGTTVWTSGAYCQTQPKVVYQLVFVDTCSSSGAVALRALSLLTGKPVWTAATGATVTVGDSDTLSAHHLYLSDAGHVRDVNPTNGAVRFTLSGASVVLAVDQTRVYAQCQNGVCGYDVDTGKSLWRSSLTSPANGAEANGVLYLDGGYELNAATGRQLGRLPGSSTSTSLVAVGSGHVAALNTLDNINDLGVYGL